MKKGLKYVLVLFLFVVFGFFIGVIFSNNDLNTKLTSININPFILIGLFLLAYFLSTAIHEVAHAIYFILNHMKLRYMSVFVFCLYRVNKHYKFKININNITLFGGIVIPEIPIINSNKELRRVQNIYSEALLVAPLISLLESLLLITALFFTNDILYIELPTLFYFIIFNIFISMTIFISSFIKTENVYGDFPAFKNYRFNDKFATIQLLQYMFFNITWKKDILESEWLIEHFTNKCHSLNKNNITMLDIDMIDLLLNLHRMNFASIDNELANCLAGILENDLLFSLPPHENRNVVFYHLLYYFYLTKKFDKIYLLDKYESKKEEINFTNKYVQEYYENLTKHIMFQEDKSEWLINNISPNSTYNFFKNFESVRKVEIQLINQNNLDENL